MRCARDVFLLEDAAKELAQLRANDARLRYIIEQYLWCYDHADCRRCAHNPATQGGECLLHAKARTALEETP